LGEVINSVEDDDNAADAEETPFTEQLQQDSTSIKFVCFVLKESSGAHKCEVCGCHSHTICGIN
jgi:hypothetical protein